MDPEELQNNQTPEQEDKSRNKQSSPPRPNLGQLNKMTGGKLPIPNSLNPTSLPNLSSLGKGGAKQVAMLAARAAPLLANPGVLIALGVTFALLLLFFILFGGELEETSTQNQPSVTLETVNTEVENLDPSSAAANAERSAEEVLAESTSSNGRPTIPPSPSSYWQRFKNFLEDFVDSGTNKSVKRNGEGFKNVGKKATKSQVTYKITARYPSSATNVKLTYPIPQNAGYIESTGNPQEVEEIVEDDKRTVTKLIWDVNQSPGESSSASPTTAPAGSKPTKSQGSPLPPSTGNPTIHNLGFGPSNAARIDNFVRSLRPSSPIVGQGGKVVQLAKEFGMDPLMIIVFLNESQFCTDTGVVSPGGSDPDNFNCGGILWGAAKEQADTARWHASPGPGAYTHIFTFVPTIQDGLGLYFDYIDASFYKGKTIQGFYDIYNPCSDSAQYGLGCGAGKADEMMRILKDSVGPACTGDDCYIGIDDGSTGGETNGNMITKSFTVTLLPLGKDEVLDSGKAELSMDNVDQSANTGSGSGTTNPAVSSGKYISPSDSTCGGSYSLNSSPTNKNYGDPACSMDKNKIYELLKQKDPQNADFWFNKVIPCESGFNPNAYLRCFANGVCTPDPNGAWGLFQMGSGVDGPFTDIKKGSANHPGRPEDRGDVNWELQIDHAIGFNNKYLSKEGLSIGAYWACAQ